MKMKKLALALGTVMMMSVFGMSAAAITVDSQGNVTNANDTSKLELKMGASYTVKQNEDLTLNTLSIESNANLVVEGSVFLENAKMDMYSGSTMTVQDGGRVSGYLNDRHLPVGSGKITVDLGSNASFSVSSYSVRFQPNTTYKGFAKRTVDESNNKIAAASNVKVTYAGQPISQATEMPYSSSEKIKIVATDSADWKFSKWTWKIGVEEYSSNEKVLELSASEYGSYKNFAGVFTAPAPSAPAAPTTPATSATPATPAAQSTSMNVQLKKTTYTAASNAKKAIKPAIKTVHVNGKKLAKKYYKVTYKNNKKPGIAQVIVTGKGKYKALRATVNFTIKPAKESLKKVKAGKNTITATWKKQAGVVGYEVQYSTNRKFTDVKKVYTEGYRSVKTTIQNLTSKTTYYVRVRSAVLNGKDMIWGNFSSVKKVKVK